MSETNGTTEQCQMNGCQAVPTYRVFWPGRPPIEMCFPCALRAKQFGQAMGTFYFTGKNHRALVNMMPTRYHSTRCVDGRRMRHDPQPDDPYLETDIGQCEECDGEGCELPQDIIGRILAIGRGKVNLSFIYPPIPIRQFDWVASFDNDEPDDDGNMICGYGKTRADALNDLLDQYENARGE